MKGIIYKYTFPDGKVYIGQTRNPEKRKREHIDPKTGPVNTGFWEAYQKFGTYEYEVLREIESDNEDELIDLLNRWESGYIDQYKADNPEYGYNRTSYASVGIESKKILRRVYNIIQENYFNSEMVILESASEKIWRTKQPLTEEEFFLITEKYPDRIWFDNLKDFDFKNLRKNRITEQRELYLDEHIGYIRNAIWECSQYIAERYVRENEKQIIERARLARTIVQMDKEGNVVKEYGSILEICQAFNIERGDNIRNVLKGKQKTAYGFFWKYKKDM
jgi:GIY-YIG catalytic domain.